MKELIEEVKKKREFSQLPNSIVERALNLSGRDVKKSRALLRKYFGVFLTNRVLKGRNEEVLKFHLSSMKRNYRNFYKKIFSFLEEVNSIVDLGCGVTGFSYPFIEGVFGSVNYVGIEASGQLVKQTNSFFIKKKYANAKVIQSDLFDVDSVVGILRGCKKPRLVFMFQIVDALESFERNFSKKFISEISKECDFIVLSLPLESLGRKRRFSVERKWLVDFLLKEFKILSDLEMFGERVIVFSKK